VPLKHFKFKVQNFLGFPLKKKKKKKVQPKDLFEIATIVPPLKQHYRILLCVFSYFGTPVRENTPFSNLKITSQITSQHFMCSKPPNLPS